MVSGDGDYWHITCRNASPRDTYGVECMDLSKNIKEFRKAHKLSQKKFAKIVGTTFRIVQRWESKGEANGLELAGLRAKVPALFDDAAMPATPPPGPTAAELEEQITKRVVAKMIETLQSIVAIKPDVVVEKEEVAGLNLAKKSRTGSKG